jgi:hypothetical protein
VMRFLVSNKMISIRAREKMTDCETR